MGRNSSKVNSIAHQIIAEHRLTPDALGGTDRTISPAQFLWNFWGPVIRYWLKKVSPGTLGEIVASRKGWGEEGTTERTSMYEIHSQSCTHESGIQILITLATTAIVAEVADILVSRLCRECGDELVNGRCKNCQDATDGRSRTLLHEQPAPDCSDCGAKMIRNGACYKCLNCGDTSGCS